ncbi:MAG TPA: GNAT family N-acetyltransferase [Fimbriimonadaceae bacterium]|nr:GNAT family N-acetyltransferase [Fimbriimonadaceae bacterium]
MKVEIREGTDCLDREKVYAWLSNAYWAKTRSTATIEKSFQSSLCFSAWIEETMVGFARVVTDRTTFAWLCDVIVCPEHRGQGIGKELVARIMEDPELLTVRWMLGTRDAHSLYARFGFENSVEPDRFMIKNFAPRPPR